MSEYSSTDADEHDPRHESREGRGIFGRSALFLRQVVSELRRVVTPSVEEWKRYTIVVTVFVIIIVAIVMVLDLGFGNVSERVLGD